MPNKELTAKVKLNTSDVESKLKRLENRIKRIQVVLNGGSSSGGIDTKMARAAIQVQDNITNSVSNTNKELNGVEGILGSISNQNGQWKLDMEGIVSSVGALIPGYGGVVSALSPVIAQVLDWLGITEALEKLIGGIMKSIKGALNVLTLGSVTIHEIKNKVRDWWEEQKQIAKEASKTNTVFDSIWGKVRQIVSILLGIGSIKLAVETSDTLTGAENRLNNIAHNVYGDAAYIKNSSGNITGFSQKTLNFTQEAMDKMYAAAKRSRYVYSDMMANVSKTMTLAGNAFDYNIDNAIRFQEVMAKSFAISGASAQEMSTSMYQLTQALGSGVLQGDELRSVREGASLAYQEIEKFAQGALDTTKSLKDLASQGKITSDMVVAAVLNMGNTMDQQFAMTKWRFSEVWNSIKSSAERAFQPVVKQLSNMLNKAVNSGLIEKFEKFFNGLSKSVMIVFDLIEKGINWVNKNWDAFDVFNEKTQEMEKSSYGLKDVVVGALIVIGSYFAVTGAIAVWNALVSAAAWIAVNWPLLVVVGTLALMAWSFYKAGEGGVDACGMLVKALKWVGIALAVVGLLTGNLTQILIGGILLVFSYFMGHLNESTGKFVQSVVTMAINFYNFVAEAVNNALGMGAAITTVAYNINVAFANAWHGAAAAFWDFVADVLDGLGQIAVPINSLLEALGMKQMVVSAMRDKAEEHRSKIKDYKDPQEAFTNAAILPILDADAIGKKAGEIFSSPENFNNWFNSTALSLGDKVKNWISEKLGLEDFLNGEGSFIDKIGNALGLDFSEYGTSVDKLNVIFDELLNGIDDISGDTGSIADSMELTNEDLEYLRKIADMEWKKEFTTANITVDMTNNNNISGDGDLDGIVTKLTDKLYEELDYMANGVYAY